MELRYPHEHVNQEQNLSGLLHSHWSSCKKDRKCNKLKAGNDALWYLRAEVPFQLSQEVFIHYSFISTAPKWI